MKVDYEGKKNNLPDFLFVGTGKAGTSSIYKYLKEHPEVFLPEVKETLFYQIVDNPNKAQLQYLRGVTEDFDSYLRLFEGAQESAVCGEVTPSYLYYHNLVIPNIQRYHPNWKDLKIAITLRNPIEKVISQYFFVKNTLKYKKDSSIEEMLQKEKLRIKENKLLPDLFLVDTSLYYQSVKAYLSTFDKVEFFLYDDLKNSSQALFSKVCDFIEVDNSFVPSSINEVFNKSQNLIPRNKFLLKVINKGFASRVGKIFSPQMQQMMKVNIMKEEEIAAETIERLKKIFHDDIKRTEDLISIELSHWLK